MKTYTTEEIKEWLSGLKFVDCYGNPFAVDIELNGAIDSFIKEIDDKESNRNFARTYTPRSLSRN